MRRVAAVGRRGAQTVLRWSGAGWDYQPPLNSPVVLVDFVEMFQDLVTSKNMKRNFKKIHREMLDSPSGRSCLMLRDGSVALVRRSGSTEEHYGANRGVCLVLFKRATVSVSADVIIELNGLVLSITVFHAVNASHGALLSSCRKPLTMRSLSRVDSKEERLLNKSVMGFERFD